MKTIPLTNSDQVTFVDDQDYEYLMQWSWRLHRNGYAQRGTTRKDRSTVKLYMHRVIMGLTEADPMHVDHVNDIKLDNQRNNLRYATRSQNTGNMRKHRKGTSKYKGVSIYAKTQQWQAQINCNKIHYYLGLFTNEIDAALAYNAKALELFGAFARINEL